MPHDCNGSPLRAGDEVTVRFLVKEVFPESDACNINLQAMAPDGLYAPFVTCNTRLVEKVGKSAEANPV